MPTNRPANLVVRGSVSPVDAVVAKIRLYLRLLTRDISVRKVTEKLTLERSYEIVSKTLNLDVRKNLRKRRLTFA